MLPVFQSPDPPECDSGHRSMRSVSTNQPWHFDAYPATLLQSHGKTAGNQPDDALRLAVSVRFGVFRHLWRSRVDQLLPNRPPRARSNSNRGSGNRKIALSDESLAESETTTPNHPKKSISDAHHGNPRATRGLTDSETLGGRASARQCGR